MQHIYSYSPYYEGEQYMYPPVYQTDQYLQQSSVQKPIPLHPHQPFSTTASGRTTIKSNKKYRGHVPWMGGQYGPSSYSREMYDSLTHKVSNPQLENVTIKQEFLTDEDNLSKVVMKDWVPPQSVPSANGPSRKGRPRKNSTPYSRKIDDLMASAKERSFARSQTLPPTRNGAINSENVNNSEEPYDNKENKYHPQVTHRRKSYPIDDLQPNKQRVALYTPIKRKVEKNYPQKENDKLENRWCHLCQKVYSNKGNLRQHMELKHLEKPLEEWFKCD